MTCSRSFARRAATRDGSDSESQLKPCDVPRRAAIKIMTRTFHAKLLLVFLGWLSLPFPASSPAQSLGEVARQYRKEQEAQKKKGEVPVRVFTNDDIARMPPITIMKSSLQAEPSPETKPAEPSQPPETAAGKAGQKEKSREYWQARFKTARAALARAKEEQTLVEDELHLLQIQQARELNPDRSRELNGQVDASAVELDSKRAATEKAQSTLDKIKKEFKESGAPQDWILDDTKPDESGAAGSRPFQPGVEPPHRP